MNKACDKKRKKGNVRRGGERDGYIKIFDKKNTKRNLNFKISCNQTR